MNAFEMLQASRTEKTANVEKAHSITPTVEVVNNEVVLKFPLDEIAKCRPSRKKIDENGKERGGGLGFMANKVDFRIGNGVFTINPGWVSLK